MPFRVGIIAEGKSDWLVLEAVMRALKPDLEFQRLRPDYTLVTRSPFGWRGVRAWCQEFGPKLELLMQGIEGLRLDLLVIHIDCSMAKHVDAEKPCPPAMDTASALRDVVKTQWLRLPAIPSYVILATPSQTIDAWVISALDPPYKNLENLECDKAAEDELVARRLLRRRDGEVKKPESRFRPLVEQVVDRLNVVCRHCGQAVAFREEFLAACGG